MNRQDINRKFTEKVTELIAQGFQINTGTMGGSQGEIAHVDLSKGDEIIRVLYEQDRGGLDSYDGIFSIRVGRNTDPNLGLWNNSIWNERLEILSEIKFARVTDDYFVTPDEGKAMAVKRYQRWKNKDRQPARELTADAFKSIALRYVQKQPRMKTCKLADIESVKRINQSKYGKVLPNLYGYEITARGKRFYIMAPHHEKQ